MSTTQLREGDVAYRRRDGAGTRLYARMPGLGLAVQQYEAAVRSATTNPRCPFTMVWIVGLEHDYCWIKPDDDAELGKAPQREPGQAGAERKDP
jgi:hypothetical protein